MATKFTTQATNQLAPAYKQQITALNSQVPAIQQLYDVLDQGLAGQQQAGNQNVLEDASSRGLLRSTIPVEGQTALGQQIIQQQGLYAAQEAKDLGGVRQQIGGLQADQANAISQLASALQQAFNSDRSVTLQQQQNNREYALQKRAQQQQYKLGLLAARRGY